MTAMGVAKARGYILSALAIVTTSGHLRSDSVNHLVEELNISNQTGSAFIEPNRKISLAGSGNEKREGRNKVEEDGNEHNGETLGDQFILSELSRKRLPKFQPRGQGNTDDGRKDQRSDAIPNKTAREGESKDCAGVPYRLGDIFLNFDKIEPQFVLDCTLRNFPNSLAACYIRRATGGSDLPALRGCMGDTFSSDVLDRIQNKSGHKLLVHLRLGDSLDGIPLETGWDARDNAGAPPYSASEHWGRWLPIGKARLAGHFYDPPRSDYEQAIRLLGPDFSTITEIVVMGNAAHNLPASKQPGENSMQYARLVETMLNETFENRSVTVTERITQKMHNVSPDVMASQADADLAYALTFSHVIVGGGAGSTFGELLLRLCVDFNGSVISMTKESGVQFVAKNDFHGRRIFADMFQYGFIMWLHSMALVFAVLLFTVVFPRK